MTVYVCKGLILAILLWTFTSQAINIDGKLDFGGESSHSSIISSNDNHKKIATPTKVVKTVTVVNPTEKHATTGLVCGEGGCNKTESTEVVKNQIKADVIVHVETKVDLEGEKEAKKPPVEEIPDIPIVIGYKGAKLDETPDDHFRSKPVILPSLKPVEDHTNTGIKRIYYGTPVVGHNLRNTNNLFPGLHQKSSFIPSRIDTFYRYGASYPSYTGNYAFNNDETSYSSSSGIIKPSISTTPYQTSNDGSFPSNIGITYRNGNDPVYPIGSLINQEINVNIKTLPPIAVHLSEDDEVYPIHIKYKNNGTRITVPYFEPSFHSHYYGENPPPQHVWYSKDSTAKNNVEFKTTKPFFTPSKWYNSDNHKHAFTNDGQGTKCYCKTGSDNTPLGWYPTRRHDNPGIKIDDKLAPLD